MIFDSTALEMNSLFSGEGRLLSYSCAVQDADNVTATANKMIAGLFICVLYL